MSNLTGHRTITRQAITELQQDCGSHPLVVGISGATLDQRVILRDVYDVMNTGHWSNFAQSHHFMRRFENQTEYQAYEEGVAWVRSNARDASIRLMQQIGRFVPGARSRAPVSSGQTCGLPEISSPNSGHRHMLLYTGSDTEPGTLANWQDFGNALHALQDSFSRGHVHRAGSDNEQRPGAVERILRYEGTEREGHEEHDDAWRGDIGGFSMLGRQAVNASKALIMLVLSAAINNYRREYAAQNPSDIFVARWLAASPQLRSR